MRRSIDLESQLAGVMDLSDLTGTLLRRFQLLLGGSGSLVSCFEENGGIPSICGGSLEPAMREYPSHLVGDDPIFAWNRAVSPGVFLPASQYFDLEMLSRSRAYADFYRRHEIGCMCGIRPTGLPHGTRGMFSVMFSTPTLSRPFEASRLDRLRQLEVPLRAAAARIARFRAAQDQQNILYRLLERQRAAIVLWDRNGQRIWVSPDAEELLEGLPARASSGEALLGRPRQLRSPRGRPLMVEFSWVADSAGCPWLVAELKACRTEFAALMGLTNSEARVLRMLARGLQNREIAEQLNVSLETVKTHVKHILSKLGVTSRAQAIRFAPAKWVRAPLEAFDGRRSSS